MIRRRSVATPAQSRWVVAHADSIDDAVLIAMAALLERHPHRLDRAARSPRRVGIGRWSPSLAPIWTSERELVDALARDHLVDYPDSLIVAWIASDSGG